MKIVSWNCNQAFRNKQEALVELEPDISVIQECENPSYKGSWEKFSDNAWTGDNINKGLGAFTREEIKIESHLEDKKICKYALPLKLNNGLKLLCIWAKNDKEQPKMRYISQAYRAIKHYSNWIDENTIILGDFNWNANFQKSSALAGDFSDTLALLKDHNMKSAYHSYLQEDFGGESSATFHMYRKENRKYHIDYIFIPRSFEIKELRIGKFKKWTEWSDHKPLILEFRNPN